MEATTATTTMRRAVTPGADEEPGGGGGFDAGLRINGTCRLESWAGVDDAMGAPGFREPAGEEGFEVAPGGFGYEMEGRRVAHGGEELLLAKFAVGLVVEFGVAPEEEVVHGVDEGDSWRFWGHVGV